MGRFPSEFSHEPLFPKCFLFSLLKRAVKVRALVIFTMHRIQDNFFSSRDAFILLNLKKKPTLVSICILKYTSKELTKLNLFGRKILIMHLISMRLCTNCTRLFVSFVTCQSSGCPGGKRQMAEHTTICSIRQL